MNPNPLQELIDLLQQRGFVAEAEDMGIHVTRLKSADAEERSRAAQAILDRCHLRWLGDIYMEGLPPQQWWSLLERCAKLLAAELTSYGMAELRS